MLIKSEHSGAQLLLNIDDIAKHLKAEVYAPTKGLQHSDKDSSGLSNGGLSGSGLSNKGLNIRGLSIDSRTLKKGDVYLAIRGKRCDGHDFIKQAIEKGAQLCIVDHKVDHKIDSISDVTQLIVSDCTLALGQIASLWLAKWRENNPLCKVIAITGSCGKTTVKEMLTSVLQQKYASLVLSTQGNLNNEYGVPLTIMKLKAAHQVAIIEMGANHQNEICYLASIAKPDIAIVTNAGSAHVQGFGSLSGVAKAKGELYSSLSDNTTAIINNDDHYAQYWKSLLINKNISLVTFAINEQADFALVETDGENSESNDKSYSIATSIKTPKGDLSINLSILGRHNIANALAAIAVGQLMQLGKQQIKQGLQQFKNISGRLELSTKQKDFELINDSYNANPDSVKAAIDVLAASNNSNKILILGDMAELGSDEIELHQQVGEYAAEKKINQLYTVGSLSNYAGKSYQQAKHTKENLRSYATSLRSYATVKDLNNEINKADLIGGIVIVKGSRKMAMENVFYALEQKNTEITA